MSGFRTRNFGGYLVFDRFPAELRPTIRSNGSGGLGAPAGASTEAPAMASSEGPAWAPTRGGNNGGQQRGSEPRHGGEAP